MALWVNHVTIAAAPNGTADHTIDPAGGTVVGGSSFTPTAGRLLVVVANASVTSTTPSGWTLPTNGSAINNTGLYVWHRTAAGSDTFTTTHNVSNFPAGFDIYEFHAGSTFVASASAINVNPTGSPSGPTLSGLTGTNLIMGAAGQSHTGTGAITWTWAAGVEATDTYAERIGSTDGYVLGVTYLEDSVLTSTSIAVNSSDAGIQVERLLFAVTVASNPNGAVTAVTATGSGAAIPPVVSAFNPGQVTAVTATGAGAAVEPVVTVTHTITGGGAATGTGVAIPPTVTAGGAVSVTAVTATGSGLARVPSVQGGEVTDLPAAVTFGSVKGWLGKGVNQAPDADGYADLVAAQGTVTFTPTVSVLLFPAASPDPLVLIPEVVVATLDEDGYLIGTKTGGTEKLVRLIVGTWTVTYQLTGVTLPSHPVTITGGATVDLVTVIPT